MLPSEKTPFKERPLETGNKNKLKKILQVFKNERC